MQNRRNYYRILQVQPDAPVEVIHASYLTLMRRLRIHPDLGGDHARAALINEAFATLKDPQRRAEYDRSLASRSTLGRGSGLRGRVALPAGPASRPAPAPCVFCGALNPRQDAAEPAAVCGVCASPLFPAVKLEKDDAVRRVSHRVPREIAVTFYLAWPLEDPRTGTTDDISILGMQFTTGRALSPGQRLTLTSTFCDAVGVVRHARRVPNAATPSWKVGVEFLTVRLHAPRGGLVSLRT